MANTEITIFYSWQSDLPGNETRNLIQDSIKDAVRLLRDTVDIEASWFRISKADKHQRRTAHETKPFRTKTKRLLFRPR